MAFEISAPRPQRNFSWVDLAVLVGLVAVIYGITAVAREWSGQLQPVAEIHLDLRYLPLYTLFSLTRGVIAYVISFFFTMTYGYVAARVKGSERVMLPMLDILQSIPVLGFLPGFVLGLIHLFPHRNLGLEIASVLMIFTGQVWNMTFSFYYSLKSVPEELNAVARLSKLTWWQRFLRLDLSYAASGLVWNSMLSMAGGWFFLTVSEAFVLGSHDFRLPGLGSYMSLAIEQGNVTAQVMGVVAMGSMIVFLDQLVWRPVVAWSQKFSDEDASTRGGTESWLWDRVRRSRLWGPFVRSLSKLLPRANKMLSAGLPQPQSRSQKRVFAQILKWFFVIAALSGAIFAGIKYFQLLHSLSKADWKSILLSTAMTFGRVIAAVALASLWTIPVGVMIGRNPRWSRAMQPIIQMVASFPAPMLFPIVVALVLSLGGGLGIGSVFLLLLGTQWYVLFNVISGSSAIPRELWEVSRLKRLSLSARWRKLILPGIFPSLLTGWITAMGGAWNASIVAEYMKYKGQTLSTIGLGALISQATDEGRFALLGAAVGVMSFTVVLVNRLVWRPLTHQAQTRYSLDN
ncbi:ABC transporter permease [Pedosphaera parvula]|uniref:Binding-protein-dependent transport systems inner membrane component n=1 Tax=Pedosphaera parvula (strain Ellin514) TaxID=320771 RepID=B9XIU3_PEDPL|nr:ABC transporter permease subunit [Pedosphaera parvula]EEF60170.1 binding-protein-dependent transport systems inner membrane component [Pedosphaera parvula Ellin514]